jgi:hypothetical protein
MNLHRLTTLQKIKMFKLGSVRIEREERSGLEPTRSLIYLVTQGRSRAISTKKYTSYMLEQPAKKTTESYKPLRSVLSSPSGPVSCAELFPPHAPSVSIFLLRSARPSGLRPANSFFLLFAFFLQSVSLINFCFELLYAMHAAASATQYYYLAVDSVLLTDLKPWPFQIWSLLKCTNELRGFVVCAWTANLKFSPRHYLINGR